jgi:hypothetical protein
LQWWDDADVLATGEHLTAADDRDELPEPSKPAATRGVSPQVARRARQVLPTIQITLLSIIVALAFENLLEAMNAIDAFWERSALALLVWLQALGVTATVLTMWSGTALLITLKERPPRTTDFLIPIAFLALLHVIIANLGNVPAHLWFYAAAAGAALAGSMVWLESPSTAPARARPGGWRGARLATQIQFALAGLTAAGGALVHAGLLEIAGSLVFAGLYFVVQFAGALFAMSGWRRLVQRVD